MENDATERKELPGEGAPANGNQNPFSKPDEAGKKKKKKDWDPKKHFKKKTGFESSSKAKFPKLNHIQWYVLNKMMMDDIGSYPYGYPIGKAITEGQINMHTAGLAVLKYCIAIPGDGEAWRMAATRFETTVRAKNSRSATYTGNDLLMSQCCYASVYGTYAYVVKHFGLLKFFSYKNNFLTQTLVTSLGCDYSDLVNNQANYREEVNQLGRDLMSLLFVKGMTLFDRWSFLNMNLFTDTESAKTQIYQFKPTCVWKWTPQSETLGSSLTGISIPEKYKLGDLIQILRECIDSLRGDDDIKYMNADIAKAYPDNEVVVVKPIDSTFSIEMFGNTNIKDQIQNARIIYVTKSNIVPTSITNSAKMTFPVENMSDFGGGATYPGYTGGNPSTIITTDDVDPTSEDTIVKSRFMNTFVVTSTSPDTIQIESGTCGSEIINSVTYIMDATDSSKSVELIANGVAVKRDTNGETVNIRELNVEDMIKINAFRWHCYFLVPESTGGKYSREYPTDNFTLLGVNGLEKMNNSVAVAMLNITAASNTGVSSL